MILADGTGNCPASLLIRINGVGNWVAVLAEVRERLGELNRLTVRFHGEIAEHEVAVRGPSGTLARQFVVSENLQHDGGDPRNRTGIAFEGVGGFFRICAGQARNILAVSLDLCVAGCRGRTYVDRVLLQSAALDDGGLLRLPILLPLCQQSVVDLMRLPFLAPFGGTLWQIVVFIGLQGFYDRLMLALKLLLGRLVSVGLKVRAHGLEAGLSEGGDHAVVIIGADRIEFVVVAAGAGHRKPEHGGADRADQVVQLLVSAAFPFLCRLLGSKRTGSDKARRGDVILALVVNQIPGQLHAYELIVWQILIECLDDEIPIVKGAFAILVEGVAITFRKTRQVQPVASPALAETFTAQNFVHQFAPVLGIFVIQEYLDLRPAWRKSGKSHVETTNRSCFRCLGSERDPFGLQLMQHELIDRVGTQGCVFDRRWGNLLQWAKGPKGSRCFQVDDLFLGLRKLAGARVGASILNPLRHIRDLPVAELCLLRRHLHVYDFVPNHLHQQTLFRLTGDNRRPAIASPQQPLAYVDIKSTLQFVLLRGLDRVTVIALFYENRPNL